MKSVIKSVLVLIALLAGTLAARAQVKIGNSPTTINGGSVLELESTDQGLMMPRINLTNTTTWGLAGTPAAGMHVYNTNMTITSSNTSYPTLAAKKGEYYWDGTGWVALAPVGTQMVSTAFSGNVAVAQTIPANVLTKMNYTAESYDRGNDYNTSLSTFTVPSAGIYQITACITWGITAITGTIGRSIRLYKNGAQINGGLVSSNMTAGVAYAGCGSTNVLLAAGDVIELYTHVGSTAITINPGNGTFEALKLSN